MSQFHLVRTSDFFIYTRKTSHRISVCFSNILKGKNHLGSFAHAPLNPKLRNRKVHSTILECLYSKQSNRHFKNGFNYTKILCAFAFSRFRKPFSVMRIQFDHYFGNATCCERFFRICPEYIQF